MRPENLGDLMISAGSAQNAQADPNARRHVIPRWIDPAPNVCLVRSHFCNDRTFPTGHNGVGPRSQGAWMDLAFQEVLAAGYTSSPQKIKALSEHWIGREAYCPSCGHVNMTRYGNNRPVADFFCSTCLADFELKSQGRNFGASVADGGYRTMIERLNSSTNPNLLLLQYDPGLLSVVNLIVVPKYFFVPALIVERPPLSPTARRAGWIGCKILLKDIPQAGRISLIKDRTVEPKSKVLKQWRRTLFIGHQRDMASKGWLLSVMKCIDQLGKPEFSLHELYRFEDDLQLIHPSNQHIKEKIRQKLQLLRDKGFLEFRGRGVYRLTPAALSP
jgi:type II restriction enzyme